MLFATVAITLLWPRVKDYSYLALIPAYAHTVMSLWTLRPRGPWLGRGLAALLVLAGAALTAAPDDAASLAGDHRPLLFALLLWLVAGALLWVGAARGETT